jgi:hypothetical protein
MARDGKIQAPKAPIQSGEQSEADRYLDQLYGEYEAGRISFGDAFDLYTKKYGDPYASEGGPTAPSVPSLGKIR